MKGKDYTYLFEEEIITKPIAMMHQPNINFDNAATTPPFKRVNEVIREATHHYGPIGRGTGIKGDWCTEAYETSKKGILSFFGVGEDPEYQVVYVKNTTEGLNLLASLVEPTDIVMLTRMEHHSNDLPWRTHTQVVYVETDDKGQLKLEQVHALFKQYRKKIKYLAVTGASNVTGYLNPIHELARIAHHYQAKIIVDGAQLVAHKAIDLRGASAEESIDFLVFSGHKIYAPYGSGAIVGRFNKLARVKPYMLGGGMVNWVKDYQMQYATMPNYFEAGTPNLLGALAISTALETLKAEGYHEIEAYENHLKNTLVTQLQQINEVILYGDWHEPDKRTSVIAFNIKGISCGEVSERLAYTYGIATRFGKFCAHPYVNRLLRDEQTPKEQLIDYYGEYGMVRVSLGLYNTLEEINYFIHCVKEIVK